MKLLLHGAVMLWHITALHGSASAGMDLAAHNASRDLSLWHIKVSVLIPSRVRTLS